MRNGLGRLALVLCMATTATGGADMVQWTPHDFRLTAQNDHRWWSFPVVAQFRHVDTGLEVPVEAFWNGERNWVVRFTPSLPGRWTWRTKSEDAGLDGQRGQFNVAPPTGEQLEANPNLRGHVRIGPNGRYFEYADGAPFFLLADTLWAGNSARCGLGKNEDGPFFRYLDDRKSKGFTAVLMQYMRGFGDTTTELAGQRNEGGYPFTEEDAGRLNPAFFQQLDVRMDALWRRGFVACTPITWWGKLRNCFFSLEWAKRISAYLMVRYGAYNTIWSLSGEYQYAFQDCGWKPEDFDALGAVVQAHNAFRRPLSIHPSGRTDWPAPHGVQSSRPYHHSTWLDHNWLQTGQSIDRMHWIVQRCAENRALQPVKPVFCAEAYYERPPDIDADHAYHSRWQAWAALLSGAAGYGYGAFGVWQFYDPDDPNGETGKKTKGVVPWREALAFEGSTQLKHVREVLTAHQWWRLEPCRKALTVDGRPCPGPTKEDLTPPLCAAIPDELWIIYMPRGNASRHCLLQAALPAHCTASWVDPRTGEHLSLESPLSAADPWPLPDRPAPQDEDWVLVLQRQG